MLRSCVSACTLAMSVGLALPLAGCQHGERAEEGAGRIATRDDDENEVQVGIDDVPAAVREAIHARAGGGTVHEIERSSVDGVTRYEVEIVNASGQHSEFVLAADGSVLADGDDDDDGPDDDGPDDDEP
jgi:hypothetical protein